MRDSPALAGCSPVSASGRARAPRHHELGRRELASEICAENVLDFSGEEGHQLDLRAANE